MRLVLAALVALFCCLSAASQPAPQLGQASKDSVWVPTPERVIRRMLQMADTTQDDLVIDLGSGDGRIPVYAGKHFGARAIGVELEGNLVQFSRSAAKTQGVSHLVQFVQQDLYEADISKATVIALYISPGVMDRLKPRLLALKPGTRVVSHHFTLGDWEPDETIKVEGRSAHLWIVPAPVEGEWAVNLPGEDFRLRIERRYQVLETSGRRGGKPVLVIGPRLRGTEVRFTSFDRDGSARHFIGRLEGERLLGQSEGEGIVAQPWMAARTGSLQ
ncbi:MAG: SAM-dependent methyltransferase [Betaproteobacteria bacterium]